MMKQICGHNLPTSLASETNTPSSPYPPDPGEHVLKQPDTEVGEQGLSVNWFKFIHPSPKPRMTETPVQKLVHVAYSPIAFMNYKWIINLHDGYHLLHILPPEEYIPPSFHTLCNLKPTMFHIGENHLCSHKILTPPGDNGENLEATDTVDNESHDDLYKLRAPIGHQGPLKVPDPNLIRCKYNVLDVWETGENTYVLTSAMGCLVGMT